MNLNLETWFNVYTKHTNYQIKPNPDLDIGYKGGAYLSEHDSDREHGIPMYIPSEALRALSVAFAKAADEAEDD